MDPATLLLWEGLAEQAFQLGVRSFDAIKGLMSDAGVADDDAAIAALQTKWDALYADVERASQPPLTS